MRKLGLITDMAFPLASRFSFFKSMISIDGIGLLAKVPLSKSIEPYFPLKTLKSVSAEGLQLESNTGMRSLAPKYSATSLA